MNQSVEKKFATYPPNVADTLRKIRELILTVAKQEGVTELTETLKWGEPSYVCQSGSTIRFDWKAKCPEQYCVYFNCKTRLIETFKEVYGDTFTYAGNRAIVFNLEQPLLMTELAHCFSMALNYKKVKYLPLLGA